MVGLKTLQRIMKEAPKAIDAKGAIEAFSR